MRRVFICFWPLLLMCSVEAWANEAEFRDMLRDLNERYEDFFVRRRENDKWLREMRKGIGEYKAEAEAERRASQRALEEHRRQRKSEPDLTPLERQHEAEEKAYARRMEGERKEFARQMQELRKIESSARHIPPDEELDLYSEGD